MERTIELAGTSWSVDVIPVRPAGSPGFHVELAFTEASGARRLIWPLRGPLLAALTRGDAAVDEELLCDALAQAIELTRGLDSLAMPRGGYRNDWRSGEGREHDGAHRR